MGFLGSTEQYKKVKVKRKGVHAKTKTSTKKGSKNYIKIYNGQGK